MRRIYFLFIAILFLSLSCEKGNITRPNIKPPVKVDSTVYHDPLEKRYETEHFMIYYPIANDTTIASEIANYCESVYDYVNTIYNGNAPDSQTDVYLTREWRNYYTFGGFSPEGIYLSLNNGISMKQIFAHEVGHVAFWHITDRRTFDYDFINEGISVIIEIHYELEINQPEPWDMRAYWAAHKGEIHKDELSYWNRKKRDLGNIFYAVGYTFNKYFRESYGIDKWVEFITNLPSSSGLSNAFEKVGLDYDNFYDEWISGLTEGANTYQNLLSKVPVITDSLIIENNDDGTRDVKVKITVQNGELSSNYDVYFSHYINDAWSEPRFRSQSAYFEKIVLIGENLVPGTLISYDIVTWSTILMSWIKSGWKTFTLY